MTWRLFEKNVTSYLNSLFDDNIFSFKNFGSSNSNKTDISVFYRNKVICNIECKYKKSQSSQFVLLTDFEQKKFIYSKKNKSPIEDAYELLQHMNGRFGYYSQKKNNNSINNTLLCDEEVLYNFVMRNLSRKADLIISSDYSDNFNNERPLTITPISKLPLNYNISATYRTKRSGTRAANKNDLIDINIETIDKNGRFFITDKETRLPIYLTEKIYLSNADRDGNREIRIRSNTNNANVIFTLSLKNESKKNNTETFIRDYLFQLINN